MNKLHLLNHKLEWLIVICFSIISLYFQFTRIIFLTSILIYMYDSFYRKYRNKEILINHNYELFKLINYIYLLIVIIRYLLDPMLFYNDGRYLTREDYYLFNRLFIITILYFVSLLYKKINIKKSESFYFDYDENLNNKLLNTSLLLNLVLLLNNYTGLIFNIITVIIHLIIRRKIDLKNSTYLLIVLLIITLLSQNFISFSLMFIFYLNYREKNKKTLHGEIEKIMSINAKV